MAIIDDVVKNTWVENPEELDMLLINRIKKLNPQLRFEWEFLMNSQKKMHGLVKSDKRIVSIHKITINRLIHFLYHVF